MKLTNKLNLPGPVVEVIKKYELSYDREEADYTPSSLNNPARLERLKFLHKDELEEDAADKIHILLGQAIHGALENAGAELAEQGYIVEKRFYGKFIVDGKSYNVGPKIDVFHAPTGVLQDYKVTSVYSVKGGLKEEYAQQTNIGAELLRVNGHTVNKLEIVAILRDWSKGEYERELKAAKDRGFDTCFYPEHQVVKLEVPMVTREEVHSYIEERIRAHEAAKTTLPLCSKEERWVSEEQWALMKKGQKRAQKLFDNEEAAQAARIAKGDPDLYVEHREGRARRCESYCPVSRFCKQFQDSKKK